MIFLMALAQTSPLLLAVVGVLGGMSYRLNRLQGMTRRQSVRHLFA